MGKSIKLIYNPAARGGKSSKIAHKVKSYYEDLNCDFGFVETSKPLDAIDKVLEAKEEGYSTVVSIGGDGTANEVANGAIKAGVSFGLIPAGSGNDFAKAIGLNGDWKEAADVILDGKREKISVVKAGDRYSINIMDIGLGAKVAKLSIDKLRWMKGSKKYTLLMVRALLTHKPYACEINIDGEIIKKDINMLTAGFGQSFGSGMLIQPHARYNNDLMDVAIIHCNSRFRILRLFPKVFSGKHIHYEDYVTMKKAKRIEITPLDSRELLIEAEGELVGATPAVIEKVPNALEVIIPKDWSLDNPSLWSS